MRICFVTTGLGRGGAERALLNLCTELRAESVDVLVVSLTGYGAFSDDLRALGVEVLLINIVSNPVRAISRARGAINGFAPHIIQSWMYHADFFVSMLSSLSMLKNSAPICWGIRHSTMAFGRTKLTTMMLRKTLALMSHVNPAAIICCAQSSAKEHLRVGYARSKIRVVPNGLDAEKFRFNEELRTSIRRDLGIGSSSMVFGAIGRNSEQKGYSNLLLAFHNLRQRGLDLWLVIVGRDVNFDVEPFKCWRDSSSSNRIILLEELSDPSGLYSAFDCMVSSSVYGEAFPNVIAEALASGLRVVGTEIGDAASLISENGSVVPAGDVSALEIAMLEESAYESDGNRLPKIGTQYTLAAMNAGYREIWSECI